LKYKKVLYAVQGTGNGHVARAREIIPILQQMVDVDVWLGGTESEVLLPQKPKYHVRGFVMLYNRNGGVSYWRTMIGNNYIQIIRDIFRAPVKEYDLIINDFEFVTAWASKLRKANCIALSHQASFKYKDTPRPYKKEWLGEFVLKNYAPAREYIGFHFRKYHKNIYPPVIRQEIRNLKPEFDEHITVYQPAYHHTYLIQLFKPLFRFKFQVFSKFATQKENHGNVTVFPVNNDDFLESFRTCSGVICGAGFETPAEAMYLGKRVLCVPIQKQYEQYCNGAALLLEGVQVIDRLDETQIPAIYNWASSKRPKPRVYPNYVKNLLESVVLDAPLPQFSR
jgi:uncharacterized protein (TIGR00661 family)